MSKRKTMSRAPIAKLALVISFGLSAAGCEGNVGSYEIYDPTPHYERYPIEIAKGKVSAEVKSAHGSLTLAQKESVARFAQQARSNAASAVYVRRPSGGGRSVAVADEIVAVLIHEGVAEGAIVQTTYPAGARSPVLISYTRRYAVTRECGDWSESLSATGANDVYPNFGCAQQNNIAALVANPEDIEAPRAQTPSDPMRRNKAFMDYRDAKPTNTQADQTQQIAISTVAK
jgi:pilus assembly protein CpaD